jgi:glucose/arabinose dehydrogenase
VISDESVSDASTRFVDEVALEGLDQPTAFAFAPDGRVFVAEKSGVVKVFESIDGGDGALVADLRPKVYNEFGRGLLSLTLDPDFEARPYLYVTYTFDGALDGSAGPWNDECPTPPGPTQEGCVVSGRLSRLELGPDGDVLETPLIRDWCQQFPSHSIGDVAFGRDGALYMSAGEGASWVFADYGQRGNACGDPPGAKGVDLVPPTAEGGALRSQDLKTSDDPLGLSGTVIRVDPGTGAGLPDNPLSSRRRANARRIVAYGLRNPYRLAVRPDTGAVFVGESGWRQWDEINRIDAAHERAHDFGWPCYEGRLRQPFYDALDLKMCERLYLEPKEHSEPFVTYRHRLPAVEGDTCRLQGGSPSGLAFYPSTGGSYPSSFGGGLFWSDYSRQCIFFIPRVGGRLDRTGARVFQHDAIGPVDLEVGPDGSLYYASLWAGTIRRIRYVAGNLPPHARISASATSGAAPLEVTFDGSGSSDADGDALTYDWDLDGDGQFGDSSVVSPEWTYEDGSANVDVSLRVSDGSSTSAPATVTISPGNAPPAVEIVSPPHDFRWKANARFDVEAAASDPEDGPLPDSAYEWSTWIAHCDETGSCHRHPLRDVSGSRTVRVTAPDHEFPARLGVAVTATDSRGVEASSRLVLDPRTVLLDFKSRPGGMRLMVGWKERAAPFSYKAILRSTVTISALSPQRTDDGTFEFVSWSDGEAATHDVTARATEPVYTARFETLQR